MEIHCNMEGLHDYVCFKTKKSYFTTGAPMKQALLKLLVVLASVMGLAGEPSNN